MRVGLPESCKKITGVRTSGASPAVRAISTLAGIETVSQRGRRNKPGGLVDGALLQARLSRKLWSNWYLGLTARYLDILQAIDRDIEDEGFNLQSAISSTGIGLNLDYGSRD
jgi:hypothetical protein